MDVPDQQVRKGGIQRQSRHLSAVGGDLSRPVQSSQHGKGLERLQQGGAARGGHVVERGRVVYAHHLELQNDLGQGAMASARVFLD